MTQDTLSKEKERLSTARVLNKIDTKFGIPNRIFMSLMVVSVLMFFMLAPVFAFLFDLLLLVSAYVAYQNDPRLDRTIARYIQRTYSYWSASQTIHYNIIFLN